MTKTMIAEVFGKAVGLACELGVRNAYQLPGCWEHSVDGSWWIALNAHDSATPCSHGASVPPFTIYVEFNGWPAGFCDAGGGTIAAGSLANEDALIAALDKAIEKVKAEPR